MHRETTKVKPQSPEKERRRKWMRRIKYVVLTIIVLLILQAGIGYWLLSSRWEMYVSEEKMASFAAEVSSAEPLPENFTSVYTALFPRHIHATMSEQIFFNYGARMMFRDKDIDSKPHCFCDMVYDIQKVRNEELGAIDWNGRIQDLEYGFGIERYALPEKCFDYVIQEKVKELKASLDPNRFPFVVKPVDEFTEDEIIELILLTQSKSKFNRYKNPKGFDQAFAHYKARLADAKKK